jgi:hydroxyacylglutathione hydrolase
MPALQTHQFPCRSDNFGLLLRYSIDGSCVSIDAPETGATQRALAETGWTLTHILTTHHHADHVEGNLEVKAASRCQIIGPRGEKSKIPGIDRDVGGGDSFDLGDQKVHVLDTPGHTLGHISYWFPQSGIVAVGDTLFSLGCGRIIEGDAKMMWASLQRLMALPPGTSFYCGHEYTEANARFALTIEPGNEALVKRAAEVKALRAAGQATLPSTIGAELLVNPFLRPQATEIRKTLGMADADDWQVFAEVRERKNKG